eukprot:4680663-Lingulodinium_polyedra.AAC.1
MSNGEMGNEKWGNGEIGEMSYGEMALAVLERRPWLQRRTRRGPTGRRWWTGSCRCPPTHWQMCEASASGGTPSSWGLRSSSTCASASSTGWSGFDLSRLDGQECIVQHECAWGEGWVRDLSSRHSSLPSSSACEAGSNMFLTELKTFFPSQLECMRGWINDVLYKLWEDCDLDRAKFVKLKRKYMVLIMNEEDLNKALYLP